MLFAKLLALVICSMASFVHSWERDQHVWEHIDASDSDASEADPYDDVGPDEAGEQFATFLVSLCLSGKLSAKSTCVLAWWASRAGAIGPCRDIGLRPDAATGHFQRKIDKCTGMDEKIKDLYSFDIPGHARFDHSRSVRSIEAILPNEILATEVSHSNLLPLLERQPDDAIWRTPQYLEHLGKSAEPLFPVDFYLDGVAFAKRDSALGFWVTNLVSDVHHLIMVLRKSELCKCGCRGWCSIWQVFELLRHSFWNMLQGFWPVQRHDNKQWFENDAARALRAGMSVGFRCMVVRLKGDWAEFCHTLGFPSWSSNDYPCIFCTASKEALFNFIGFNPISFPHPLTDHAMYVASVTAAEVSVQITAANQKPIALALQYDKRTGTNASFGRALVTNFSEFGLQLGDRLEPSTAVPNVGAFELLAVPFIATFWRPCLQTRAKHRNPILMGELGITVASIAIDVLHTLNLGVYKHWVMLVFWYIIDINYYKLNPKLATEEKFQLSVMRLGDDLDKFYKMFEKREGHNVTRVNELSCNMLGSQTKRKLKTKAAETRWLIPFCIDLLQNNEAYLGDIEGLLGAGKALETYLSVLDDGPAKLTNRDLQVHN
jgi:hypothetical protein